MADKLGVHPGTRKLVLGRSWLESGPPSRSRRKGPTYHTIRYDFKPASVADTSDGFLEVDETKKGVSVTIPHKDSGQTRFSGHQKPANEKDGVLIIDPVTGSWTLEKLSSHILLKKTREERADRSEMPPIIGAGPPPTKKSPPKTSSPYPRPRTPLDKPKAQGNAPALTGKSSHPSSPYLPAQSASLAPAQPLPSLSPTASGQQFQSLPAKKDMNASKFPSAELSSSSSSSSSDSNSDSDSDSDDNFDEVPMKNTSNLPPAKPRAAPAQAPLETGAASSMPDFMLGGSDPAPKPRPPPPVIAQAHDISAGQHQKLMGMSMPQILNDDLELSESDSDS